MSQLSAKLKRFTMGMQDEDAKMFGPLILPPPVPRNDGLRFPARAIAVAIIESALADIGLICNNYHTSRQKRVVPRHQREACAWIMSRDRSYPMSFENLCEYVDFDANRIRDVASRVMTRDMV